MDRKRLVRHLLGQWTSEGEAAAFEDEALADGQLFAELLDVEEELIEAYLDGTLDPGDQKAFETAYLASPPRRARVDEMRELRTALARYGTGRRRSQQPWLAAAAALAAVLAVVFFGVALYFHDRAATLENELAVSLVRHARPGFDEVPLRVAGATVRSAGHASWLIVPGNVRFALLLFKPPAGMSANSVPTRIETAEGAQVWAGEASPAGAEMSVRVPAGVLRPGDYVLFADVPGHGSHGHVFRIVTQ